MRHHTAPWLAAALAALAVNTACTREPETAADARHEVAGAAEGVAADINDGWITTKIQAKYFADRDVKARDIDVSTHNGVVTLTGRVENEAARHQAISIARNTDGVVRVEDRLASDVAATTGVTPAAGADRTAKAAGDAADYAGDRASDAGDAARGAWITTKIQAKYFADPIVKGRRIDVTTNNGVVALTGRVENNSERQQAMQLARETEGVRRVEDRLQIVSDAAAGSTGGVATGVEDDDARGFGEQMTDAGITARVQSKFFMDDTVKARNINVNTSNGVVTLEGEVQSELEREQAMALARSVDGVTDVQSQLQVNRASAETSTTGQVAETAREAATAVDDAWITTKIQSKFFVDDLVKAGRVDVTTQAGVVTLTGQVGSQDARQRAEALARQTSGVIRVDNKLTVGSESTTTSAAPAPEVPAQ